jgi:hypothetical protein
VSKDWRAARNERALDRLIRARRERFPEAVWRHALGRPLIPPTPTRAVESYWRHHPLRADRLARALAARSGAPEGWSWRVGEEPDHGPASFRTPPAPYRSAAFARGPGHCRICGQPVFRFGWHADLCADGVPNARATWHLACVAAWKLWNAPSDQVRLLRRLQGHRCGTTGRRLLRSSEVDHRTPLFRVWRDHRDLPWPALLAFWGLPNLQVVNRDAHLRKSLGEAAERRISRKAREPTDARPRLSAADVIFHLTQPPG